MANSSRSTTSADERALQRRGYILGGKIGQGSYAKVRSCTYVVDSRQEILACKIIDRSKAPSDFLGKFFPRELDIITWLDHPHVIRVHSILERQERVFIFMQYCENGDLLDYVRDHGVIKEPQARVWFKQMYAGLSYLHSRNIAHRDLKCENVLLTRHWNVKLGDFGFARAVVDQDGRRVLSETYCGSAAYAAPEVVRGNPYNPKMSDIWSLGVILYIMVNAAMPFDDSNLKKMLKDQQSRNWHLRSKVRDKLGPEIKEMLNQILEPDVTRRITIDRIGRHVWLQNHLSFPRTDSPENRDVLMDIVPEDVGTQSSRNKGDHKRSPESCNSKQVMESLVRGRESFFDITAVSGLEKVEYDNPLEDTCYAGFADEKRTFDQMQNRSGYEFMARLEMWHLGRLGPLVCGGAIISENWVLTSARCAIDEATGIPARTIEVTVGDLNSRQEEPGEQKRNGTAKVHPLFDRQTLEYDLALIELSLPLVFGNSSGSVGPVTISSKSSQDSVPGQQVEAIGWGQIDSSVPVMPTGLRAAEMQVYSTDNCRKDWEDVEIKNLTGIIPKIGFYHVCLTGPDKGQQIRSDVDQQQSATGICTGDIGGPIVTREGNKTFLIGISSFMKIAPMQRKGLPLPVDVCVKKYPDVAIKKKEGKVVFLVGKILASDWLILLESKTMLCIVLQFLWDLFFGAGGLADAKDQFLRCSR
ncbi:unnamed protein product, partial [Notodromas monacha]